MQLTSMHKVLGSIPNTQKEKDKEALRTHCQNILAVMNHSFKGTNNTEI